MTNINSTITTNELPGEITPTAVDVNEHGEMSMPASKQLSAGEKTEFMKEFEKGMTIEEARKSSHEFIRKIWKK